MKLVFITHRFYPDVGGIEVHSEILATAFQQAGHDVRLLTWTAEAGEKTFPFTVIRNPTTQALLNQYRWADVIFINNPSLRLTWPGFIIRKPSVVALHTWIRRANGQTNWQDRFKLWWLRSNSAVIAVSDAIRKAHWPGAYVIGNPYWHHLFRKLPNVQQTADFVFLGRLVSDKGVALAIEALHQLTALRPTDKRLTLTIVGDGPERQRLDDLVRKYALGESVVFTGTLRGEALVTCLNQHRFLVVPSVWEEPFGNVALEGMACGCLPIVSDGGGLPDAIGKAGLTFARGSVDALTATIQKLIDDSDLQQQLSDAADEHLKAHHPDVIARQYLAVVENVLRGTTGHSMVTSV